MADIIVGAILLAIVGLAAGSILKDKKSGKPACGGSCGNRGCAGCVYARGTHAKEQGKV